MITITRIIVLIVAAGVLSACASDSTSTGDGRSFVSGDGTITVLAEAERRTAPPLSVPTIDGGVFESATTSGRVTVVNLWASWCAPCRAEAPTLVRLAEQYDQVVFLGLLTRDNVDAANAFARRFELNYPTIMDEELILRFGGALAPNAIPTTLVLDRQGRVAARLSGAVTDAGLSGVLDEVLGESP
jgi:thiol-disulfide isomerase/thioredoxin